MSASQQARFLEKLHQELSVSSQDYRDKTLNKRMHTFTVTRRAIRRGMKDRIAKNFPDMPKKVLTEVLKKSDVHVRKLIRDTGRSLIGLSQRDEGISIIKFTPARIEAAFEDSGVNRFNQIKGSYDTHWSATASGFSSVLRDVLNDDSIDIEAKSLWNLEHNHLKGIIETQVKDAVDNACLEEQAITMKNAQAWFKGMGIDLSLIRNGNTGVMEVFLGSQRANAKEGGISGAKMKKLRDALIVAIRTLDNGGLVADLGGSDSFKESKIKSTRRKTLKPFKKLKNVKVTSKDSEKDDSITNVSKDALKVVAVSKSRQRKKKVSAKRSVKAGVASEPLQLIGIINKALPDTVRKNMQSPQLVNRTGRFAESVKVTDIIKTPKGFPSVGYTYQRNPYGVFEDGSGSAPWANGERDPRQLIDKSIREIAAQFALGRFYTRRE